MENQRRKITGYRDLSQAEIDLMNLVKNIALKIDELLHVVDTHVADQFTAAAEGDESQPRLQQAQPFRWVGIARTDFQTGFMALTRAVAQPTTF